VTAQRPIILATRNPHKLREVRQILRAAGWDFDLRGLDQYPDAPDVPETAATFADNAVAKAVAVAKHTGLVTVADDSGLEVDALGGRPGVMSNRFAGPGADDAARIGKLLGMMRGVARAKRTARFRCAAAVAAPAGDVTVVEGVAEGWIAESPRGERGFGYDPAFVPRRHRRTFAQMTPAEKNRISHRGHAFRAAAPLLARM
jgi:XTP/dITP diphosphohydrolase